MENRRKGPQETSKVTKGVQGRSMELLEERIPCSSKGETQHGPQGNKIQARTRRCRDSPIRQQKPREMAASHRC